MIFTDFYVDERKRRRIIKEKRKNVKGAARICFTLDLLFRIVAILPLIRSIWEIYRMEEYDYMTVLILISLGLLFSGILGLFAFLYNRGIWYKFLVTWIATRNMELHLEKNGVEYGSTMDGYGDHYRSYYIAYKEIEKIEYDPKNYLVRICGKIRYRMWDDVNRQVKQSEEIAADKRDILFLEYFQDFDKFMEILQEKSGVNVEITEICI